MINREEKQIGDYRYAVTQFAGLTGMKWLMRITKSVSGALLPMIGLLDSKDPKFEDIAKALSGLTGDQVASLLDEKLVDDFCMAIGPLTTVYSDAVGSEGVALKNRSLIDAHFKSDYIRMVTWIAFALEVNFRDFLAGLSTASPSQQPTSE